MTSYPADCLSKVRRAGGWTELLVFDRLEQHIAAGRVISEDGRSKPWTPLRAGPIRCATFSSCKARQTLEQFINTARCCGKEIRNLPSSELFFSRSWHLLLSHQLVGQKLHDHPHLLLALNHPARSLAGLDVGADLGARIGPGRSLSVSR